MANRRMINKSISVSTQVNNLSDKAKILFTWTIPHMDDDGRIRGEPAYLRAVVVPMMNWSNKKTEELIDEIVKNELWDRYKVGEDTIIQGVKWRDHQTIQPTRYKKSELPEKPISNALNKERKKLEEKGII